MSSGGSETTSWRYGLRPTGRPGTLLHRKEQLRCGLYGARPEGRREPQGLLQQVEKILTVMGSRAAISQRVNKLAGRSLVRVLVPGLRPGCRFGTGAFPPLLLAGRG